MRYIHIRNLEKYHPGYKDRTLQWAKIYFRMVQGDPDCELIKDEIDWARLLKIILLELEAQKPLPDVPEYWTRKGFNLRKRSMSLTIQVLHNFIEVLQDDVDVPTGPRHVDKIKNKKREDKDKDKDKDKDIYMEFVKLTSDEHSKLLERFGEAGLKERIASLNNYIGKIGVRAAAKKYKSHYFTILSWERKDGPQATHKKTKLFPISGKTCGERGCGLPAVYKSSGEYSHYYCTNHMPEEVKEKYE